MLAGMMHSLIVSRIYPIDVLILLLNLLSAGYLLSELISVQLFAFLIILSLV